MDKLDKKLALWRGFKPITEKGWEEYYKYPKGAKMVWTMFKPNFTKSLDACFKWLVPEECSVSFNRMGDTVVCLLTIPKGAGMYGSYTIPSSKVNKGREALALCLVLEKFMDSEEKANECNSTYL